MLPKAVFSYTGTQAPEQAPLLLRRQKIFFFISFKAVLNCT